MFLRCRQLNRPGCSAQPVVNAHKPAVCSHMMQAHGSLHVLPTASTHSAACAVSHASCAMRAQHAGAQQHAGSQQGPIEPAAGSVVPAAAMLRPEPQQHRRWDAKTQYAFFHEGRDWQAVQLYWQDVVNGTARLSDISVWDPQEQYNVQHQQYSSSTAKGSAPADSTHAGSSLGQLEGTQATGGNVTQVSQASSQLPCGQLQDQDHNPQPGVHSQVHAKKKGKQERITYRLVISYLGAAFEGWAWQPPPSVTVEGRLSEELQAAVNEAAAAAAAAVTAVAPSGPPTAEPPVTAAVTAHDITATATTHVSPPVQPQGSKPRAHQARTARLPPVTKAILSCAGRTDKGVSALCQVVSFYSWYPLGLERIAAAVRAAGAHWPLQSAQAAQAAGGRSGHGSSGSSGCTDGTACHSVSGSSGSSCDGSSEGWGAVRLVAVEQVPRSFHATFAAGWRRYVYLFPLRQYNSTAHERYSSTAHEQDSCARSMGSGSTQHHSQPGLPLGQPPSRNQPQPVSDDSQGVPVDARSSCFDVDVQLVDEMLQQLVGRPLDFSVFARDMPAGKDPVCTLHRARASLVHLPARYGHGSSGDGSSSGSSGKVAREAGSSGGTSSGSAASAGGRSDGSSRGAWSGLGAGDESGLDTSMDGIRADERQPAPVAALCVEVVADRFLRRMMRVLVGTAVLESLGVLEPWEAVTLGQMSSPVQPTTQQPIAQCTSSLQTSSREPVGVLRTGSEEGTMVEAEEGQTRGERGGAATAPGGAPLLPPAVAAVAAAAAPADAAVAASGARGLLRYCVPSVPGCRPPTSVPAPALGLCFAGAGYEDGDLGV